MADETAVNHTALTVDLLASYVANNNVRSEDLAGLIASTHAALAGLDKVAPGPGDVTVEPEHAPAVTARKSLANPNHILSMIDGKPYKSLKRHLSSRDLTPDQYRQRYNLPASYPMVASGYSEQRREVAKRLGLGRKPRSQERAPAQAEASAPSASVPKPPRKPRSTKAATTV